MLQLAETGQNTFSVLNNDISPQSGLTFTEQYSRPTYLNLDEPGIVYALSYTGSRWFGQKLSVKDLNWTVESLINIVPEYHGELIGFLSIVVISLRARCQPKHHLHLAFWGRDYSPQFTVLVSDTTRKDTPVGVDFYEIGERGDQFGE